MNKKIFGAALIAAMAVTAGWNFNQSKNEVGLSDLAMANVEALARDESWTPDGWICYRYSYDDGSSFFFTYTRCMDCNISSAVSVSQQEHCWH